MPNLRLPSLFAISLFAFGFGQSALASNQPGDILGAYGFKTIRATNQGEGQTIAVYAPTSATYTGLQADLDKFSQTYVLNGLSADLSFYYADALSNYGVSGYKRSAVSTTSSSELAMDVQYAHYIAPKAKIVVVSGDNVSAAAQYASTVLGANIFTTSYASYETSYTASNVAIYNTRFGKADAAGMAIFSAVGDSGPYDYPASSPYVVGVGGTNLYVNSSDVRTNEISWSTGGGGQSIYNVQPSWQYAVQNSGWRQGPDVAIAGGAASAVPVIVEGSTSYIYGSSLSSPLWAGLAALIQEARADNGKASLGTTELMTLLYGLYNTADYSKAFYDITASPSGAVHTANAGFDLATGLGVPNVPWMVNYLANVPEPTSLALVGLASVVLVRRQRRSR